MAKMIWIPDGPLTAYEADSVRVNELVMDEQLSEAPLEEMGISEARRRYREGGGGFPAPTHVAQAEQRTVETRRGPAVVRIFEPTVSNGAYLFIHGGGWVSGAPDLQDTRMWRLACDAEVTVVCASYGLAPEHPYPQAVDDCESIALWLLETGRSELNVDRLVIGGESSGAHLATLALLRLRDHHDAAREFCGANLLYGLYDLSMSPSLRLRPDGHVLPLATVQFMIDNFLVDYVGDRADPAVSPIYADLSDMPDALFTVGDLDPLLDDTLIMGARWMAADNSTSVHVYPSSIHAFDAFPTPMAAIATDTIGRWIAARVKGPV
ncbi:MAG: alpha/beta hydrolase [Actinobacteria bacterium]|nr:alpha/beta hydrolase [Actinomycetota bacterium]